MKNVYNAVNLLLPKLFIALVACGIDRLFDLAMLFEILLSLTAILSMVKISQLLAKKDIASLETRV